MLAEAGTERRRHPRKVVQIDAHVACKEATGQAHRVTVQDLSLKGMAIETNGLSLNIGDRICLCLSNDKLKCGAEHVIEAVVVNLRGGTAGLQFETVGIHVLTDLQQLLHDERTF